MKLWSGLLIVVGFVVGLGSFGMPDGGAFAVAGSVLIGAGTIAISISSPKRDTVNVQAETAEQ
jgi:hypothetical protein